MSHFTRKEYLTNTQRKALNYFYKKIQMERQVVVEKKITAGVERIKSEVKINRQLTPEQEREAEIMIREWKKRVPPYPVR